MHPSSSVQYVDFRSDNVAPVCPEIMAALAAANTGTDTAYGGDNTSRTLNRRFSDLFETEATVFPVSTGTAANALSLAACTQPYGGIYCHELAHIGISEGNAVGVFSGGAMLMALPGDRGCISAQTLEQALREANWGNTQKPQPDVVSVTQATERGTVYQLEELAKIGDCARDAGLRFHMDGSRFANAAASLQCTPAAMVSRSGVDILSFGATKNGGMNAEAIVVFRPDLVEPLAFRLRRAGQTWSKMRFSSIQLLAYVEDNLYLRLARQANAAALRLGQGLQAIDGVELADSVQANIVFPILPSTVIDALAKEQVLFARRASDMIRLVCRYNTTDEDVDCVITTVARLMNEHAPALV